MSITLSQMRGFLALAEHLSFKRAAAELGITQPALSNQVTALEKSLGVQLLTRTTRSSRLTPAGESFLRRLRRIVADLDSTVSELRNPLAPQRGVVTFACIPTIAGGLFPRIMRQYQRRHPEVVIEMVDEDTADMERRIVSREVDFGVGGIPRRQDLTFTEIFADPFAVVCRRDHPLARKSKVSLAEALRYPVISLAKESNVGRVINAYCSSMGHEFKSAFEVLHHYTIGAMVSAGLGITFLPSQATILLLTSRNLKVVPFSDAGFARPVGVITRQGESLSAVAEAFCAFTIKSMLTMTPGGTAPKKPARRKAGTAAARGK